MLGNISAAVKAHRDPKIQNVIVERMIESHLKSKVIGCDWSSPCYKGISPSFPLQIWSDVDFPT